MSSEKVKSLHTCEQSQLSLTRDMPITINSLTMSCFYFRLLFSNFLSILSNYLVHAEIRSRTSMYYLIKKSANLLLHVTLSTHIYSIKPIP